MRRRLIQAPPRRSSLSTSRIAGGATPLVSAFATPYATLGHMPKTTVPPAIAYFSMEVGLDAAMPTYSGGLGVLAGDTLRAAADQGLPMVGVTLLHRKGYFRQRLDASGVQTEADALWTPAALLEPLEPRVIVEIEGRDVAVRAWRFVLTGATGASVPVYFLDTALPENDPRDQEITDHLYGGDNRYRLCQEAVLGIGGVVMLRALGHTGLDTFHMNEGHSALLTLALLEERLRERGKPLPDRADVEAVHNRCVFTTHTPVPAGQDQFPNDIVTSVLGQARTERLRVAGSGLNGSLDMTHLGLVFSRYVNGVAMRHGEVSREMFPGYIINAVTNGVHATTWTSPAFATLFDRYIPEWRRDNLYLRYAVGIPVEEVRKAHALAKRELIAEIRQRHGTRLNADNFTIGFARRATAYKRADLLLADPTRLIRIAEKQGPLQIIYGGKSHPRDEEGKEIIKHIFEAASRIGRGIRIIYLEEYDITLAKYLTAGVDLWLNTPRRPLEASGTSGMKAALNGVPSLSTLDGWWIEGHLEGVTGWSIGEHSRPENDDAKDSGSLYAKLEQTILPLFYGHPEAYGEVMRSAIAINGSFFNAQRMVLQYFSNAYQRNRNGTAVGSLAPVESAVSVRR